MGQVRIQLLFAAMLLVPGCIDGNPSRLLEVDGWMRHASFSKSGQYLYAVHSHVRPIDDGSGYWESPDSLSVWAVGTWEKVFDYTPPDDRGLWWAYTCTDPDVIITNEDCYPDESRDLVWRSITSGEELGRLSIDIGPWDGQEYPTIYCDHEENLIYMDSFRDRVVAVDGTTGEVKREYRIAAQDYHRNFWINKLKDRIAILDAGEDIVSVFRLSTGELLGAVDIWPEFRPKDIPIHVREIDEDHLLYIIVATNDLGGGIHYFVVDLDEIAVTSESLVSGFTFSESWVMGSVQDRILMAIHLPTGYDPILVDVNYKTGQLVTQLDMAWHGQGQIFPIPSLSSIFLDDWRAKGGTEARMYSYPDLELLHKGRAPIDSEEKQFVSDGQFIVMESYFSDRFGVYDPVKYRVIDEFNICQGVKANSLQISPSERLAAVVCYGDTAIDRKPGVTPKGAGVAIVDLDRYR